MHSPQKCGILLVAVLSLVFFRARAVPLANFYPFGTDAEDSSLPANDDGSSSVITLSVPFPFFDAEHTTLYVNNNGDVSFTRAVSDFTPLAFPLSGDLQLIAPYWADVDTRGTGTVWYRETTDPGLLARARDDIQAAFIDQGRFVPDYLFIATWDHVGYYDIRIDKTNTFQCVMATNGVNSFVIFLYADGLIQWTTGDASGGSGGLGGTPAQVGFNAGDGVRFASVPGSRTAEIINIASTTNVGVPGVWIFRVDEEDIITGGCSIEEEATLTLAPRLGNKLGGTPVQLSGPCFRETDKITCTFQDDEDDVCVRGVFISEMVALCISPALLRTGRVVLQLTVRDAGDMLTYDGTAVFYSLDYDRAPSVSFESSTLLFEPGESLTVTWDPESVFSFPEPESYTVDIRLYRFDFEKDGVWLELAALATDTENIGQATVTIPDETVENSQDVHPVSVQVSVSRASAAMQPEATLLRQLHDLGTIPKLWSISFYYNPLALIVDDVPMDFRMKCDVWFERNRLVGNLLDGLPPCPRTIAQARTPNSGFEEEDLGEMFRNFFHENSATCFRQSTVTGDREQQCCYRSNGDLNSGAPGGGRVNQYRPQGLANTIFYFTEDVLPFIYCCKGDVSNCDAYYDNRPSDDGSEYDPPLPACVYGDPHIVTLDGLKYTFNGKGEYTLIETVDNSFTLQGRMEEATDADGNTVPATVFSAIVAKQDDSDTVQFELSRRGLDALINGERVNFEDLPEQEFNNVTVSDHGNNTLSATFSSMVYIEVREENGIMSILIVSLPSSFREMTTGLMGSFNGNTSDDLAPRSDDGNPLPLSSTLEDIHRLFGVTWIIDNAEDSLFTYGTMESWSTFYDPTFTPIFTAQFSDPQLEADANELCGDDPFCLYDVAATGRTDIGLSTLLGNQEYEQIANISVPPVCDPPCQNGTGVCVADNTCSCSDGYEGETCSEPVFMECDINPCENGGACRLRAGSYLCDCPEGLMGSLCQIQTAINDCNCTRNIECTVDGVLSGPNEATLTGKELKCVISFDQDTLHLDSLAIDETFAAASMSGGSLQFLINLGILSRTEGFRMCGLNLTTTPTNNPVTVLGVLGIERLDVLYLREDGSFGSVALELDQLRQIISEGDFTIGGMLSLENACSFQHLLFATNDVASATILCRDPGPNNTTTFTFPLFCP